MCYREARYGDGKGYIRSRTSTLAFCQAMTTARTLPPDVEIARGTRRLSVDKVAAKLDLVKDEKAMPTHERLYLEFAKS